jgi:exopolysaccharide production protein ExoQ
MPPQVAALAFTVLILALIWFDRRDEARTSFAVWISMIWIFLASSRSVGQWLNPTPTTSDLPEQVMEGSPTDRLVYMGLIAIAVIITAVRWKKVAKLFSSNLPIVCFFGVCLVSLVWSDFTAIAFKRWIKAFGDLLMLMVVFSERSPFDAVKRMMARLAYIMIPLSVLFCKYFPAMGKRYGKWDYQASYTGVTTNKNTLGAICLFFGLFMVWRLFDALDDGGKGRFRRIATALLILGMIGWLFYMAHSMSSLAGFTMGSALIILMRFRIVKRVPALAGLAVLFILTGCICVLFLNIGGGALESIGRDSTLTDRTGIWAATLKVEPNPIVGTGFESFWLGPRLQQVWSQGFSWQPYEAHNGYLEIYLNLGWAGIVLLAAVLLAAFRTTFNAFRSGRTMGNFALAVFTVGCVYNFTEAAFFRMMAPAWLFFLMAVINIPVPTPAPALAATEEMLSNDAADAGTPTNSNVKEYV